MTNTRHLNQINLFIVIYPETLLETGKSRVGDTLQRGKQEYRFLRIRIVN